MTLHPSQNGTASSMLQRVALKQHFEKMDDFVVSAVAHSFRNPKNERRRVLGYAIRLMRSLGRPDHGPMAIDDEGAVPNQPSCGHSPCELCFRLARRLRFELRRKR
jgi:hypothetical protein